MTYEKGTEVVLKGSLEEVPQHLRKSVGNHFIIIGLETSGKHYFAQEKGVETSLGVRIPVGLLYSLEDMKAKTLLIICTADGSAEEIFGRSAEDLHEHLIRAIRSGVPSVEYMIEKTEYTFPINQITKLKMIRP